ncbi:MAG: endolytic transglycosylase MltG [Candidatus Competibacteraceae bacterium]
MNSNPCPRTELIRPPFGWFSHLLLTLTVLALIFGPVLYIVYADYRGFLDTPLGAPAGGLVLEVKPGMGVGDIAQELRRQPGVLRSALYLETYARLNGLASRLKAGEYAVAPGVTPRSLIEQMVAGRVIQYSLTVVEGWTFRQLRQVLAAHPKIKQTLQGLSDAEVMARLGRPGEHPEGRFFPDSYHFPAGATDVAFLQRALTAMNRRLEEAWTHRVPGLPLTDPYRAPILRPSSRRKPHCRRERRRSPESSSAVCKRGCHCKPDSTVICGLGEVFDGKLHSRDLTTDTPYNTYTRKGLPPTPIALAGTSALVAVISPAPGDALYFVATGEGGHAFSRTLEEYSSG